MGQMRVIAEQVCFRPAGSEHLQYQFDRDSRAADDWFSSQHLRIQNDTILPVHAAIVTSTTLTGLTHYPTDPPASSNTRFTTEMKASSQGTQVSGMRTGNMSR